MNLHPYLLLSKVNYCLLLIILAVSVLFSADIHADNQSDQPSLADAPVNTAAEAAPATPSLSDNTTDSAAENASDDATNDNERAELHPSETTGLDENLAAELDPTIPHNLSPWGMFLAADWVVKTVMIALAVASLLTWTVLLSKSIEFTSLQRHLRNNLTQLLQTRALTDAENNHAINGIARGLVDAANDELRLSADLANTDVSTEGIKVRVASSLSRIEVATARKIIIGTGLLATIGSVSPFVGLFGTVWGIMNSFIGIAESNTTNLAVVAPGIAEALLATAMGLVAAIPAVVIYNHFTRKISTTKALVSDISAAVMRLISRDLDREIHHALNKIPPINVTAAE